MEPSAVFLFTCKNMWIEMLTYHPFVLSEIENGKMKEYMPNPRAYTGAPFILSNTKSTAPCYFRYSQ